VRVPAEEGKGRRRAATREASPSVLVGTITIIAVVAGLVGAKLFHVLENLDAFFRDPAGMVFSTGGLTFYGGLILAALAIAWFVRTKGLPIGAAADSVAPGLMIAYGIGRVGCYLAGDGDWGVCNTLAGKPGWLPAFLWSETFPRSILDVEGAWTTDALVLEACPPGADGVYPTMLYEFGMALVLFAALWAVRRHPFRLGWLFFLYLIFVGLERFLIEQIRVNNTFDLLGIVVTQAEVISVLMMLAGVVGLVFTMRRRAAVPPKESPARVPSPTAQGAPAFPPSHEGPSSA
jgi:phosphatidylglycerol:prolipoprotein diacylglycerol transferase